MGESRSIVADEGSQQPDDSPTDKILQYIRENPGCHFRKVKAELELAMGTAQYQLERLEKAGRISSVRRGLYRYYFPAGMLHDEKDILQILSQETAREILMFIIEQGNPTHTEIAAKIVISPASVNWHIRRLIELDLITEEKDGKYKRYLLRGDSRPVIALLRSYYPTIWDKWSNRLAEMFLSLSRDEES
jgi:predicted transcriptional regulator